MGVLEAIRSDVPNLMKDVPNFVKDVPRVPKCIPRWRSTLSHFLMGSKMKSCTIHVQMGVPKAIGSGVPNLMKDVPNFVKVVPSVPKCIPRWGSTLNLFLMGSKMKSCTIHVQMGVLEVIGSDIQNLMKDVPNFVKDVPNFVKDVPRVPNCVSRWGSTPNHFLMGF